MSKKSKNSKKNKKRRSAINEYYEANKAYSEENRRRQQEEGVETKGLKNLNTTEKTCVAVIILGLIGIVIKYFIL